MSANEEEEGQQCSIKYIMHIAILLLENIYGLQLEMGLCHHS